MAQSNKEVRVGRASNCVAHTLLAWIIVAMASGCGGREQGAGTKMNNIPNRHVAISANHISDIFTLEREVVLSDSVFIAHYAYLDVDAEGDFLLTDIIGKQVVLFSRNGDHKATLSTDPCNPGFPWSPWQARFKPDGKIIVNSSQWGYEFANNGDCIGELSDAFEFPESMGFDDNGNIYGFYVHGQQDKGYHIRKMNAHGELINSFGFDDMYFWYTLRYNPVPDIVVKDDYVYHAQIFNPGINRYNEKGQFINHIARNPDYYRAPKIDDSEFSDDHDPGSASIKYHGKFSVTRSLWLLNDKTLMISYDNEYNRKNKISALNGLGLMDLEGNDLINKDILTHISFITAKDGYAYSFFDSTNTGKGLAAGPPSLKIYRYLHPSQ